MANTLFLVIWWIIIIYIIYKINIYGIVVVLFMGGVGGVRVYFGVGEGGNFGEEKCGNWLIISIVLY